MLGLNKKTKKKRSKKRSSSKKSKKQQQNELQLNPKVVRSIAALVFYFVAILIVLSFFQNGALLEAIRRIFSSLLGWGMIFVPVILIFGGNILFRPQAWFSRPTLFLGSIILTISIVSMMQTGSLGVELWQSLAILISNLGAFFIFLFGFIIGFMVFFEVSLSDMYKFLKAVLSKFNIVHLFTVPAEELSFEDKLAQASTDKQSWEQESLLDKEEEKTIPTTPDETKSTPEEGKGEIKPPVPGATTQVWRLPPLSLLSANNSKAERGDIKRNAQVIEETLQSFGVQAKVVDFSPGPTVTQYAIQLATGTKLTKITSLANDLALALAARTGQIRIEAPIPGRPLVGIEVPNLSSALVSLKTVLADGEMKANKAKLLVGLGLDVSGKHVLLDIAKMPHMLIAGQTGSGKSVCINTILSSILFRSTPNDVKMILVDPKRVELSTYNGIPHLLTPVIVEPEKVVSALKWAIAEMESRYKTFAEIGARNIESYNEMSGFQAMPYILIVIDELADIMLYAPSDVEDSINRLAQMARATGIHLVLATQRPSVDVITGLIKANIPARIAFSVSSMMDSRVILDSPGAEKLLGRGDMLFIPPDQAKPRRIQGAYVTDGDIKNMTDFLKNSGAPVQYTEEVTSKFKGKSSKGGGTSEEGGGTEDLDENFEEAVRIVCGYDKASASLLQRKLSIGYNRAARILDQLYAAGAISAPDGSKPREVLIKNAEEFLAKLNQ
ncbi:DNA translocase FtsK [Candidatus Beckwithbacteria bacterium]|nr:DNA translocase FtsK [Candidatus Beckwithbacteria bacterium]